MTWTFDDALGSDRDKVRLYIGDTVKEQPQLSDEAIALYLAESPNPILAAANACTALSAMYARKATSKTLGQSSISYDRAAEYRALAQDLRSRALRAGGGCSPMLVGGATRSEHYAARQNTDRSQPAYRRGQFDEPGTSENQRGDEDPKGFGRC